MTDVPADLAAALSDRYRLEREIGRGGMATVFLADDLRHDRPVALKVLHPELAASIGPARFLREVRIAARLRHPHILPVHDSGEAAGHLWYTMPFVEGESLRQRLAREGQLSIQQVVRIATQVLGALGYAHAHDVVHRDIKPENILLEGDDAVVADFGVARAFTASDDDRLTDTGLALGTPAYMSPEQASGARELDGRSDLYAVGCVIYEMLAGTPPFVGANAQQLVARHMVDTPPPIRTIRSTVPEWMERSVLRALAKLPADRFASAAEFADALSAPNEPAPSAPVPSAATSMPSPNAGGMARGRRSAVLALVVTSIVLGAAAYRWWPRPNVTLDPELVAVVPFRVRGAASTLTYLREGMIDLIAARLTGARSARAADPNSVMSAWRTAGGSDANDLPEPDALALARTLGAGQLLLGGVVGTPQHVTLSASLIPAQGGEARANASVEGSTDSLPQLVDRLVAQLVTEQLGAANGLVGLIDTPLPALQQFLEARSAQRLGDYSGAVKRYERALDIDSTFALAGLNLAGAAAWTYIPGAGRRGLERAWAGRDRLGERDRALVTAVVGPRYPETSTLQEHAAAWEHAVDVAPDQSDRWFELGDLYFHEAPYLQIESSKARAAEAFRRAIAVDSGVASIGHLFELAVMDHDSLTVARLGRLYLRRDTNGELLDFYRWRIAAGTGDVAELARLRDRMGQMRLGSLWRIMNHAVLDGEHLDDAEAAAAAIRASGGRSSDWQRSKSYLHAFEVNRGHPTKALADTARVDETEYGPHAALYERVLDALYGDGDSVSARQAARELSRLAQRPGAESDGDGATARTDECVATMWAMHQGDSGGAPRAIERLRRRSPSDSPAAATAMVVCTALLEAKFAAATRASSAGAALERLDSLMRSGPGGQRNGAPVAFTLSPAYVRSVVGISPVGFEDFANLEVAQLRERAGDLRGALAAVRRRPYAYHLTDYLATHLREEGRLAVLVGERAEAIRAYGRYLTLRSDAEPPLRGDVERIRGEFERLGGGR